MKLSILLFFSMLIPISAYSQSIMEYFKQGVSKANKGDYKGAIEDFDKVLELDPNIADALNNRGLAKTNIGDYQGAIEDFDKVLELEPNSAGAYYNRGAVKIILGQKDSGCSDLYKASKLGYIQADDSIKEYCQ